MKVISLFSTKYQAYEVKCLLNLKIKSLFYLNESLDIGPLFDSKHLKTFVNERICYLKKIGYTLNNLKQFKNNNLSIMPKSNLKINIYLSSSLQDQIFMCFICSYLNKIKLKNCEIHCFQFDVPFISENYDISDKVIEGFLLNKSLMDEAIDVWHCLVWNTPNKLIKYLNKKSGFKYLQNRLKNFKLYYPDYKTGLNKFEELILKLLRKDPVRINRVIYEIMLFARTKNIIVGDEYINWLVNRMCKDLGYISVKLENKEFLEITKLGNELLGNKVFGISGVDINSCFGGVYFRSKKTFCWVRKNGDLVKIKVAESK